MTSTTTYTLSEVIHEEFGLVTGSLFDQFIGHLCQNHEKFVSLTFKSLDSERFYTIEKETPLEEQKTLGFNWRFLMHLMQHDQWPKELYHAQITYKLKNDNIKTVTFSVQQDTPLNEIEDINTKLSEVVVN